jgi:hypothetical protein
VPKVASGAAAKKTLEDADFPRQGVSALGRRYFAPYSSQPKRPLVLNVFRLNWRVFVPEMKNGRDHDADAVETGLA